MPDAASSKGRILTRHPAGKTGVRIALDKYEEMRRVLLLLIPEDEAGARLKDITEQARTLLDPEVYAGASVPWYLTTVKQDLEARGLIEIVPKVRPQRLRRRPAGDS